MWGKVLERSVMDVTGQWGGLKKITISVVAPPVLKPKKVWRRRWGQTDRQMGGGGVGGGGGGGWAGPPSTYKLNSEERKSAYKRKKQSVTRERGNLLGTAGSKKPKKK